MSMSKSNIIVFSRVFKLRFVFFTLSMENKAANSILCKKSEFPVLKKVAVKMGEDVKKKKPFGTNL